MKGFHLQHAYNVLWSNSVHLYYSFFTTLPFLPSFLQLLVVFVVSNLSKYLQYTSKKSFLRQIQLPKHRWESTKRRSVFSFLNFLFNWHVNRKNYILMGYHVMFQYMYILQSLNQDKHLFPQTFIIFLWWKLQKSFS
jgi:hypothetical protein